MKTVRIGCGQGFWGDSLEAPRELSRGGGIDYLVLDYLAEVTMSILSKQKQRDPDAGYARDVVSLLEDILPQISDGLKVIANAGGVNPRGCAAAIRQMLAKHGRENDISIGIVEGDDILGDLDGLQAAGEALRHLESGRPLSEIRSRVQSANVYLGAEPVVAALAKGAKIVVTGRVADPSLVLAPLLFEFQWPESDWNRKASGIVAGHIVECGAQCTGGNCSYDWRTIPNLAAIGYPIIEVSEDGSFVVTKQPGTGGRIDARSVKEQLVYEIGDPRRYVTPDVVADFTSVQLEDLGGDRVRISNVKGSARPEQLKVSLSYTNGFFGSGTLLYSWPDAFEKAKAAGEIVRRRLEAIGKLPQRMNIEHIGINACHDGTVPQNTAVIAEEVMLRIAVWDDDRRKVERFTRELTPLVINGPPGATAYSGGKRQVQDVFAYWPALISRSRVSPRVSIAE